jgi:hypothetical protein
MLYQHKDKCRQDKKEKWGNLHAHWINEITRRGSELVNYQAPNTITKIDSELVNYPKLALIVYKSEPNLN